MFQTRIHPFRAKGVRRVRVSYSSRMEDVPSASNLSLWATSLAASPSALRSFAIAIDVVVGAQQPPPLLVGLDCVVSLFRCRTHIDSLLARFEIRSDYIERRDESVACSCMYRRRSLCGVVSDVVGTHRVASDAVAGCRARLARRSTGHLTLFFFFRFRFRFRFRQYFFFFLL